MKIELDQSEVENMVYKQIGKEFPDYKIENYHTTSYDHMIITLKRRGVPETVSESPPSSPAPSVGEY